MAHRRPAAERQRKAERHQRRSADASSSHASHNAIRDAIPSPDDTTRPLPASASTQPRKMPQLQPRRWRRAHARRFFASQFLLPDPTVCRTHDARSDIARTTGAPGQGGSQTDTGEHSRQSPACKSHQPLRRLQCGLHAFLPGGVRPARAIRPANAGITVIAQRIARMSTDAISGSDTGGSSTTPVLAPVRRRSHSTAEPGRLPTPS